jgi:hypothetical protein
VDQPARPRRAVRPRIPRLLQRPDKARAQAFAGRYKLALQTLSQGERHQAGAGGGGGAGEDPLAVATGRLDDALKVAPTRPSRTRRKSRCGARSAPGHGRTDEAIALLKKHARRPPDSLAGHYALGAACERVGDTDGRAKRTAGSWPSRRSCLRSGATTPTPRSSKAPRILTTLGRALDRWARSPRRTARTQPQPAILNIFVKAYDVKDRALLAGPRRAAAVLHVPRQPPGGRGELKAR